MLNMQNALLFTASLHVEHVNTKEKMQDFADKLNLCHEYDVLLHPPSRFQHSKETGKMLPKQGIPPSPEFKKKKK